MTCFTMSNTESDENGGNGRTAGNILSLPSKRSARLAMSDNV